MSAINAIDIGMRPTCPSCGFQMVCLEDFERGKTELIFQCQGYDCSDKQRKAVFKLPSIAGHWIT